MLIFDVNKNTDLFVDYASICQYFSMLLMHKHCKMKRINNPTYSAQKVESDSLNAASFVAVLIINWRCNGWRSTYQPTMKDAYLYLNKLAY